MKLSYQSDISRFIAELKQKNPALESEQRYGRSLLWEGDVMDVEQFNANTKAALPQRSYEYYRHPSKKRPA